MEIVQRGHIDLIKLTHDSDPERFTALNGHFGSLCVTGCAIICKGCRKSVRPRVERMFY